jgi:6-phosphofructokinase 1
VAFDRILASAMGVKAFEMVAEGQFGKMVTFRNNRMGCADLAEAVRHYNYLDKDHYLIRTARSLGISFGD